MPGRHTTCDTCTIRNGSICGSLAADDLARINAIARLKHFRPGDIIQRDHDNPGYFANVVSGVVKLTKTLSDGRQQIVGLQFPSDFLGRPFRARSPYCAEAADEVTLCTFERTQFERLVKETPGIERGLFEYALDELDAAQEWMVLLGRKSATERVASFLLMVARRLRPATCATQGEESISASFDLPLSRSEIADYLGLTIETVSRQVTSLKRRGVIRLEGTRRVTVPDVSALEKLAEQGKE